MDADLRAGVIARDRACVRCGADPQRGGRFSVHHRLLRSQGGRDSYENCIVLCGSGNGGCHGLVHSRRNAVGVPGGYIVPSHGDPATAPIHIHQRGWVLLTPDGTYGEIPE